MQQDITLMSMYEVSKLIAERKVSPVELVDACTKPTDLLQDELYAYITFLGEQARVDAEIAEREIMRSGPRSPMHGIPVAIKDLYHTKGILTTAGSLFLKDFIPEENSTIVQRMLDAGAINMGKTNTHSWAFASHTNSQYGQSRNPWDSSKIPGGSSGGSGIAAATGMAYIAMGSDTGGSVRIPAALCGCVGYKPSYGLASLAGIIPLSYTLDHPGPLTRSVMDCAIWSDLTSGFDPNDPCPDRYLGGPTKFVEELETVKSMKGMRVGVPINFYFEKCHPEIEAMYREALMKMKELGAELIEIQIPMVERVQEVSAIVLYSEAAHFHKERIETNPGGFSPMDTARLKQGMANSVNDYIEGMLLREQIKRAWEESTKCVDVVATPTTSIAAFPVGTPDEMVTMTVNVGGSDENVNEMIVRNTRLGNTTGTPSVSVPMGFTSENLPCGLMFSGRLHHDIDVLRAAWAYEQANPYQFPSQK